MRGLRDELRALQEADDRRGGGTLRLHAIRLADSVPPAQAEPSVKRTVGLALFRILHAQGQAACGRWLRTHAAGLGRRSSVDRASCYLAACACGPAAVRGCSGTWGSTEARSCHRLTPRPR